MLQYYYNYYLNHKTTYTVVTFKIFYKNYITYAILPKYSSVHISKNNFNLLKLQS